MIRKGWQWFPHQLQIFEVLDKHNSVLLEAPTGAGKTLASLLPSLLSLSDNKDQTYLHTLYISPLKALTNDIYKNVSNIIQELDLPITIEARTGDTPTKVKSRQKRTLPNFLMTTPESLALILANVQASKLFARLNFIIIDEIHTFIETKRGDMLSLSLSRLLEFSPKSKRIGLSATLKTTVEAKKWLSAKSTKAISVKEKYPAEISIFQSEERIPWSGHMGSYAVAEIYSKLLGKGSTLVFVNTRAQAEFVFQALWKLNSRKLKIGIHHGSLDKTLRKNVESQMSLGKLDCVVATSSLDLGVDWAAIDLIIQIGAPKGVNRLIQRIGRSNHKLDLASKAILVPTNRLEYLECFAVKLAISNGDLDGVKERKGGLDVLAQHIFGVACSGGFYPKNLYKNIVSSAPYSKLTFEQFLEVVNFVKDGGYSLKSYNRYSRLKTEVDGRLVVNSPGHIRKFKMNIGTIVEAPMLKVRLQRRTLGSIEENFILNLSPGDTFVFGGKIVEFEKVDGINVFVKKSKSKTPKLTVYAGGRQPLTSQLAQTVQKVIGNKNHWLDLPIQIQEWLTLQSHKSTLPDTNNLLVEVFPRRDRFYTVVHTFAGWNANQTLGFLLLRRMKRAQFRPMGFTMTDYGLAVWSFKKPIAIESLLDPDIVFEEFEEWLQDTPLLKRLFRDVALISGLVEKKVPGSEKTGKQILFSTDLIYEVLMKYEPSHILLQAVREDSRSGLIDEVRLKETLNQINKKLVVNYLDHVSPLAIPLVLESNREIIGQTIGAEDIIAQMQEEALGMLHE